jgi:hypothetical protein
MIYNKNAFFDRLAPHQMIAKLPSCGPPRKTAFAKYRNIEISTKEFAQEYSLDVPHAF